MTVELLIEIEARRNAEASERGAQDEHVHICCAHNDSHLAEWASGGGLLDDSPCDLFGLALDVRGLHGLKSRTAAVAREALLGESERGEAGAEGIGEIEAIEREGEVSMTRDGCDHGELGFGQRVESI